jgi:2-isopropylmalate synthase
MGIPNKTPGCIKQLLAVQTRNAVTLGRLGPMDRRLFKNAIANMEKRGYKFADAEASLEMILLNHFDQPLPNYFSVDSWRVTSGSRGIIKPTDASMTVRVGAHEQLTAGEGHGPIHALDMALRAAIEKYYPMVKKFELVGYEVHGTSHNGSAQEVCVVVQTQGASRIWGTCGLNENVIEASLDAIVWGIRYGLSLSGAKPL